jgi:hypothetical protein
MFQTKTEPMVQSNQVHTTTDYFLFKSLSGNRKKNIIHLNRLKKSIKENYLFTVIIVNESYEIIDGQHRFDVIQELALPLHYIICKGYGLNEVQVLNANSKNWTADDFMNGFCDLGYKNYTEYRSFKLKYEFNHKDCMLLLTGNDSGQTYKDFESGNLIIKDYSEAERRADLILLIGKYYSGLRRSNFIRAMSQLFNKKEFVFSELLNKISLQPHSLVDCTTTKQYLSLIEEIYNYRRREKVNLRY